MANGLTRPSTTTTVREAEEFFGVRADPEDLLAQPDQAPEPSPEVSVAEAFFQPEPERPPLTRFIDFAKSAAGRVGEQTFFPAGTLGGGEEGLTVGEAGEFLFEGFVVQPAKELAAAGGLLLDTAEMLTKATESVFIRTPENRPPNPVELLFSEERSLSEFPEQIKENIRQKILSQPEDLPTEEKVQRAQRGFALIGGALAAGGMNRILSTGIETASKAGMIQAAGRWIMSKSGVLDDLAQIGVRTGSGVLEGAAFGGTYGALEPLDEDSHHRLQNAFDDAILFGALSGFLRGLGAIRAQRLRDSPPTHAERIHRESATELLEASSKDVVLWERNVGQRQMPLSPHNGEELVAQVAAGSTEMGVNRTGFFGRVVQGLEELFQERFPKVRRIDESTQFLAKRFAQSKVQAAHAARRMYEYVSQGLTAEEESIMVRGLIASRGRAIREGFKREVRQATADGDLSKAAEAQRNLSRVNIAELSSTEQNLFSNSPKIQEALRRYKETVVPQLTAIRTRNGLRTLQETDLPFVRLIPATKADVEAGIEIFGTIPRPARPGVVARGKALARTTPGAQRASGSAFAYVSDLEIILRRTLGEEVPIDLQNELLANIISAPWSQRVQRGVRPPKTIKIGDQEWPARTVELRGNPRVLTERFGIEGIQTETEAAVRQARLRGEGQGLVGPGGEDLPRIPSRTPIRDPSRLLEGEVEQIGLEGFGGASGEVGQSVLGQYSMPRPVANMVEELLVIGRRPSDRVLDISALEPWFRFADFNVGLLLATPVELFVHSWRILGELSRVPELGEGAASRIFGSLVPYFGPKLQALREIYNPFRTKAGLEMERRIARIPGGQPSRFLQLEFDRGLGAALGKIDPKAAKAAEFGREFLFDLPKTGPGFKGFDQRARVAGALAADRIIQKELGRRITDQELEIFLRQFGQYTNEVNTEIVNFLRKSRLAPFASGQVGMIPGEIRGFFGGLNLPKKTVEKFSRATMAKLRGEVLFRGTVGTALTLAILNRTLSGRWPWENEAGHRTDLDTGLRTEDGRAVYLPSTVMEPAVSRAARIAAARAAIETFGDESESSFVSKAITDLANVPITYLAGGAPGTQAAFTAAFSRAPFLFESGELLRVVPPQPTMTLTMKERLSEGLISANPSVEAFFGELAERQEQPPFVRITNAIGPGLTVGREPDAAISAGVRSERARDFEVIQDRVSRALDMDPGERVQFLREESRKFPDDKQGEIFALMVRSLASRMRGRKMSAQEARIRQNRR